ncbi:MAG: ImmA/IrrE family metallo-endopeptidase, partial [Oenococcus sp.]
SITPKVALGLEKVLNLPYSFWMNLQNNYDKEQLIQNEEADLEKKKELIKKYPYQELAQRGYVSGTEDWLEKGRELLKFFHFASLGALQKAVEADNHPILDASFRVYTRTGQIDKYSLASWVEIGKIESEKLESEKFSKTKLRSMIPVIRKLTREKNFLGTLQEVLSQCGVKLVLVHSLPKSQAAGVTYWADSETAVIQLGDRYNTIDVFWFTLFHEISHLILFTKHNILDLDIYKDDKQEKQANQWAADALIPDVDWKTFSEKNLFDENDILSFAKEQAIDPAIVVGRLQKEKLIPYTLFHELKRNVSF